MQLDIIAVERVWKVREIISLSGQTQYIKNMNY